MEIHIGDRVADVTLVNKEGNRVELTIDGKPCVVDIVMAENGSCSILHDGNSYNAELIRGVVRLKEKARRGIVGGILTCVGNLSKM